MIVGYVYRVSFRPFKNAVNSKMKIKGWFAMFCSYYMTLYGVQFPLHYLSIEWSECDTSCWIKKSKYLYFFWEDNWTALVELNILHEMNHGSKINCCWDHSWHFMIKQIGYRYKLCLSLRKAALPFSLFSMHTAQIKQSSAAPLRVWQADICICHGTLPYRM